MVFANGKDSAIVCVEIPTTTYFLVTGIKAGKKDSYKLALSVSMS
jgi:hypothetical protein